MQAPIICDANKALVSLLSSLILIMARLLLPSLPMHMHNLSFSSTPIVAFFFLLLGIFSVFFIIAFSCASSKIKKSLRRLKEETSFQSDQKKLFSKLNSNISSKALSMVKMISWRKAQAEGEGEEEEEYDADVDDYSDEAVWRKTIMMGERCRPLDFSGKIVYDSQGNLLADLPHDQDQISKKYISVEKS